MDQATLIRKRAALVWEDFYATQGGHPEARSLPLRTLLDAVAETVFELTVIDDDSLTGTNIEGELNREDGLILLRPDLDPFRAAFVLAHEIGHFALDHPLHVVLPDTDRQINPTITPDDLSAERQQQITGLDLSAATLTALRGYSERDTYEMQANAFATELLVPGTSLRCLLRENPRRSVASLATYFGVPASLIRIGLAHALFTPTAVITAESREDDIATSPASDFPLDDAQRAAAECEHALMLAGPGAGKTRVLVARYTHLVEQGINPHHILALTFANKAAGEMRGRLAALAGPEQAANVEVFTFHSFGLQLLQQYGERLGHKLPLRLVTPMDALLLFRRRAAKSAYGFLSDLPKALQNLRRQMDAIARAKEEAVDSDGWAELGRLWEEAGNPSSEWAGDGLAFYRDYQQTLRHHGLLDYGDLQMEALRLFTLADVAEEIRSRYQYILVDEFQDINFVSGRLVRELDGGRGRAWVVGDPRQGIYGFRGASPVNLSRFRSPEYYPDAAVIPLTRNYRSVPEIVAAGAAVPVPLSGNDPRLVPPPLVAHRPSASAATGPAVTSVHLPDAEAERLWLCHTIQTEQERGTRPSDIAVLVRKNKHAAQIAETLTRAGIPHCWAGPIQDRPVFKVLMSALLLAADDTRGIAGLTTLSPGADIPPDFPLSESDRRALFGERRGRGKAKRLLAFAVAGKIPGLSEQGIDVCRALGEVADALSASARPHHNLCLYLFEQAHWLRRLLPESAQARHEIRAILATAGQVLDLASSFAAQRDALARSLRPEETEQAEETDTVDTFETETSTLSFLAYVDAALDSGGLGVPNELPDDDAVSLLTAHRSKGLEWPVVFVPFCAEGQFPSRERDSDLPIPPNLIVTEGESASDAHTREEACLFYVAVTRAEDRLYLSSAAVYGVKTKAPPSVLHQTLVAALQTTGAIAVPDIDAAPLPPLPDAPVAKKESLLPLDLPEEIHERGLSQYEQCPRQYLFGEVYGLPQPGSAFLDFHNAVYRAARDAEGCPETLRTNFEKNWKDDGPSAADWQAPLLEKAAQRLVEEMEQRLITQSASGGAVHYRPSKTYTVGPLPDGSHHTLRFTVDEIATRPDGSRAFRRHKTGTRIPKEPSDDGRTTLYALCADQEQETQPGVGSTTVTFHYPQVGQDVVPTIGTVKKKNRKEKLIQLIQNLKHGDFRPKPNETACARCAYTLICAKQDL
jgi:DNA helicase-2/ATP-dependent DNA helicase PcrA